MYKALALQYIHFCRWPNYFFNSENMRPRVYNSYKIITKKFVYSKFCTIFVKVIEAAVRHV